MSRPDRLLLGVLGLTLALSALGLEPAPATAPIVDTPVASTGFAHPRFGEPLLVTLGEPPASHYEAQQMSELDRVHGDLLKALPRVEYSPELAHAAREVARFHRTHQTLVPADVLWFFLDSAGAAVWGVRQTLISTNESGFEPIAEAVVQLIAASPERRYRVGIGETIDPDASRQRSISVLVCEAGFRLQPVPRNLPAGEVVVQGTLPESATSLEALWMASDLELRSLPIRRAGRQFEIRLPAGDRPAGGSGAVDLELIARLPTGPLPMAQLRLGRGGSVATSLATTWPPDESDIVAPETAADLAMDLLNEDRARFGLPPLRRDPVLDAVARSHSQEMQSHGYVGHVSPESGTVTDRLERAGYRVADHAENLAKHGSIAAAQSGLLRSLGHRRNILAERMTHVGVGVARANPGLGRSPGEWYLTQVFAHAVASVAAADGGDRIAAQLHRRRTQLGLPQLQADRDLVELAELAAAETDPDPAELLERVQARGAMKGGVFSTVQRLWSLDQLSVPAEVGDPRYRRLGVAVVQSESIDGPSLTVVVLLGR